MAFKNFVEIGRVVCVTFGPLQGKICVILDVLDQNRLLVEGPEVPRQQLSMKRVKLTDYKLSIPRQARTATLNKAVAEFDLVNKWTNTSYAQKLERQRKRAEMTDFDRFKVMLARKKRSFHARRNFFSNGGRSLKKYVQ